MQISLVCLNFNNKKNSAIYQRFESPVFNRMGKNSQCFLTKICFNMMTFIDSEIKLFIQSKKMLIFLALRYKQTLISRNYFIMFLFAVTGSFSCTLKFIVKDCDPNTGEADDDGYEDEYVVSSTCTTTPHNTPKKCH